MAIDEKLIAKSLRRRKLINFIMLSLSFFTAMYGVFFLIWILLDVFINGFKFINIDLFVKDPTPPGIEGGGLRHAFVGHFIIIFFAVIIGVPIGIGVGVFFAEYGRFSKFFRFVRSIVDTIVSFPSIVIGTFVYAILVNPVGHFMGISGSLALALLMIPIIAITADEVLRLVPDSFREAAFALGAHRWQVIKDVSLSAAKSGILTGVLLGLARVSGETAPLLFTSFNNSFFTADPLQPMASLTVTMFQYVMGPYEYWHRQAWASALVLIIFTLSFFILARALSLRQQRKK